ncbi:peptidyl-prolyl cis-trans isomerase, FKBP-type [Cooperia oncophora]
MLFLIVLIAVGLASAEEDRKLSWKEDDGLEIKIVKPIKKEAVQGSLKSGYTFVLGKGRVIAGMDRAMIGMCIGEKRKIVIPGNLGFGEGGRERSVEPV